MPSRPQPSLGRLNSYLDLDFRVFLPPSHPEPGLAPSGHTRPPTPSGDTPRPKTGGVPKTRQRNQPLALSGTIWTPSTTLGGRTGTHRRDTRVPRQCPGLTTTGTRTFQVGSQPRTPTAKRLLLFGPAPGGGCRPSKRTQRERKVRVNRQGKRRTDRGGSTGEEET